MNLFSARQNLQILTCKRENLIFKRGRIFSQIMYGQIEVDYGLRKFQYPTVSFVIVF